MSKILLIAPFKGNGGIASWANSYVKSFAEPSLELLPLEQNPLNDVFDSWLGWFFLRMKMLRVLLAGMDDVVRTNQINLVHTTTSGGWGVVRDYFVARKAKRYGVKTILHCHYGCIPQLMQKGGPMAWLLLKCLRLYDQVWVLDSLSVAALSKVDTLKNKVFLTPNPICIAGSCNVFPERFTKFAYVGNLLETKGIFYLVEAFTTLDDNRLQLHIIGPGSDDVLARIRSIAKGKLDRQIFLYGRLPNEQAVEIIRSMDAVVLPTYFRYEAFPISILEAMSLGKLVITCPRAAIPDMLTAQDGAFCGIFVQEKSIDDIREAILKCQREPQKMTHMCRMAYKKVCVSYRSEVVFSIYKANYLQLL